MSIVCVTCGAAFVAIAWADQKHFWRLASAGGNQQEHGGVESTPQAVDAEATGLNLRPGAVCTKQSQGGAGEYGG
jgi:hypothetical protein